MRRECAPLLALLGVLGLLTTAVDGGALADKRKTRSRTIPYRFVDPLEMKLTAPRSFDLQTDLYLRGLRRNNIHPAPPFPKPFSPGPFQPFFEGVVHPPKSFSSGSNFPSLSPQPGVAARSIPGGSVQSVPSTKPPHLPSSVQPVTTSHKILEGPYLVDAEENTSVLPLTSSIRLLKDNEKLHPSVESSVLPIKTTHHVVEGRNKYSPPVYTPSLNKAADPHRAAHNLFKESDIAYFLTNSDVGVRQKQTSTPESQTPLYFESGKAQLAEKHNKPTAGLRDHFSRPHAGFESSLQRQKNPRSTLSPTKLRDPSLQFFEPHLPPSSLPTKPDTSMPFKSLDSLLTTHSQHASPLEANRPNSPHKLSQNAFDSHKPNHQPFNPLGSSIESQDPSFFATANPHGNQVTPGKLFHSLLTTQKQIGSLLDTYSPQDSVKSFENPKGFQSHGYPHLQQGKLENEHYDGSFEGFGAADTNRHPSSKHRSSKPFDYFMDELKSDEYNFDNEFFFDTQISKAKPHPYNQDAHELRPFHKPPTGPYDFDVSPGSVQSHKPNRYSSESLNDGFRYHEDSPSFSPLGTHRKFYQKPKEIKPLKPVYAPEHKKEVHRERSEGLHNKPPVGKTYKDYSRIPGTPGKDYPLFSKVPRTSFSCSKVPHRPGIYANVETHCQAYHVCHDDRYGEQGAAFLCSNGTLFNQVTFSCDWWYKVDCKDSTDFYDLNADPRFNPYYKKTYYDNTVERKFEQDSSSREIRQQDSPVKYDKNAEQKVSHNPSRYEETVDFSVREGPSSKYTREPQDSRSHHSSLPRYSRTRARDRHNFRRRSDDESSSVKPPSNSTKRRSDRPHENIE